MKPVAAPEGFEGCRYYEDGSRNWMASARPVGATWWTNVGLVGHSYLIEEELDARAQAAIKRAISLGLVR